MPLCDYLFPSVSIIIFYYTFIIPLLYKFYLDAIIIIIIINPNRQWNVLSGAQKSKNLPNLDLQVDRQTDGYKFDKLPVTNRKKIEKEVTYYFLIIRYDYSQPSFVKIIMKFSKFSLICYGACRGSGGTGKVFPTCSRGIHMKL